MVPRIKIQRPSTSSLPDQILLWGSGNELIDTSESPRHRHHEGQFRDNEHPDAILEERVISWDDRAAYLMGEGRSNWDERMRWWKVYMMHALFMWNSRTFEYVSIVLVAKAFPHALIATSIRGITSTVSSMLFASAVGNWIDRSPSRLPSLIITISLNHAAIIASYVCWLYWPVIAGIPDEAAGAEAGPFSNLSRGFMYGLILFLDIIHDLSAIANKLSVERDWIPILVGPITPDIKYDLTQVNAVFIRIEHIVKLIAPSLLPALMATFTIRAVWILLLVGVTVLLWIVEIYFARTIAAENPELRAAKKASHNMLLVEDQSITGLASTVITPMTVQYMRRRQARRELRGELNDEEKDDGEGRIMRSVGLWGITSQFVCLIPVVLVLWHTSPKDPAQNSSRDEVSAVSQPVLLPMILFAALSLSRLGHIAIQLMVQQLGQVEIPESQRSTFAGTEQSFHSLGSLCHWAMTIVWSRPSEFRWLAAGSVSIAGLGTIIYGVWAKGPVAKIEEQGYGGIALVGVDDDDEGEDRR